MDASNKRAIIGNERTTIIFFCRSGFGLTNSVRVSDLISENSLLLPRNTFSDNVLNTSTAGSLLDGLSQSFIQ